MKEIQGKIKRDKAREQKIYIDDGAKLGRQPVDEKIYVDDGLTIGKPKKKPEK